jgi:hypothetical protein
VNTYMPSVVDPVTQRQNYMEEFNRLMGLDRPSPIGTADIFPSVCSKCRNKSPVCRNIEVRDTGTNEVWCLTCVSFALLQQKSWKAGIPGMNPAPTPAPDMQINSPWGSSK